MLTLTLILDYLRVYVYTCIYANSRSFKSNAHSFYQSPLSRTTCINYLELANSTTLWVDRNGFTKFSSSFKKMFLGLKWGTIRETACTGFSRNHTWIMTIMRKQIDRIKINTYLLRTQIDPKAHQQPSPEVHEKHLDKKEQGRPTNQSKNLRNL